MENQNNIEVLLRVQRDLAYIKSEIKNLQYPDKEDPVMNLKEACNYLKVGRKTVTKLIEKKQLQSFSVGGGEKGKGMHRFRQSYLEDYIKRNKQS